MDKDVYRGLLEDALRMEIWVLQQALRAAPRPLTKVPNGEGVYLLLYLGKLPTYRAISDGTRPIYVGETSDFQVRFAQHAESLSQGKGLRPRDFRAVFCPQPNEGVRKLTETTLQKLFRPVWNERRFRGFGSRNQGAGRVSVQPASKWDLAHPGRTWALPQLGQDPKPDLTLRRMMQRFLKDHGGPLPTWETNKNQSPTTNPNVLYLLEPRKEVYRLALAGGEIFVVTREPSEELSINLAA